ncbi:hypothetical protein E4U21_001340 [Claviceps maximensis]|nr:hypothetical protein E4U21_001340 [Claviceps maximensis]
MISTAESKSNDMAAASTFSYAQAAKGQGTVPSTTSPNLASQPQGSAPPMGTETPVESSDGPRENEPSNQAATEKQDAVSNVGSESDLRSETTHDRNPEPRRDEDAARSDRPWRQTDKGTRSSSTATRSVDEQESRRPRKGKKSKASPDKQTQDATSVADKTTKEAIQETPKVELSEAPIPSVNIWHERRQQQAKAAPKAPAVQDNEAKKSIKESSAPTSTSTVAKESSPTNSPANGVKSNRKSGGDSGRPDRNVSRGSRSAEKDSKSEFPPSVEDAASWPTPEIAIKEEQKKPAVNKPIVAQDKDSQDDGSQGKRQKEKWVTYDYVPSVNFETQLPQMRNSKPRGTTRGVNSSRAAAPTSSSSTQSSEKTAAANANASASATPSTNANKSTDSKERTKEGGANGSGRTTSLPPVSKRATMDASNAAKEQKKSAQSGGEKIKDATSTQPSQYSQQQQQPQQQPQQQHQHAHIPRSEGRSERGRGGYRGRGGHHSVNVHSHQHSSAGFSNNGPASGRLQGPYSPPPRQGSHGSHGQGFVPPHRGGRVRSGAGNNFHRMSLPNGATRLPSIQATFGGSYEYPMHPMSAVPFQQPLQYWDGMVIGVLKNQIEYYFSIENLCKDMYLRKRMDSQGFVHLHFVSAFKRIRELTQDMAMIRAVCEASTEIDFVVGEDDIERLRRRNGWQSFVLPMEDRDDFARNAGPSQLTFKNRALNYGPQFNGAGPLPYGMLPQMGFSPQSSGQFHHFPEGSPTSVQPVNGIINGHSGHNVTPLSANVPDFSPSGPASGAHGQGSISNHTLQNTNGIILTNGVHTE